MGDRSPAGLTIGACNLPCGPPRCACLMLGRASEASSLERYAVVAKVRVAACNGVSFLAAVATDRQWRTSDCREAMSEIDSRRKAMCCPSI